MAKQTENSRSTATRIKLSGTAEREVVITRVLNAPRELVFRAWTDPNQLIKWWGPTGFSNTSHEISVKPGGIWRFTMHGPDGIDYPNRIIFSEIDSPRRIVYLHDNDRKNDLSQFRTTVIFSDRGKSTEITMKSQFATKEERDRVVSEYNAIEGGNQTLDRLGELLATITGSRDLIIERFFNVPCGLVWIAWSDPEHLKRWWGPKNYSCPGCDIDFRVGGSYLTCMRSPEGQDFWTTGVYREIIPLKRIVYTDSFADENGNVVSASHYGFPGENWPLEFLVTVTIEDLGGRTKMTLKHEALPGGTINDDTRTGWNESFDKMEISFNSI